MLKVKGTEIQQMLTELMVEALGPDALPFDTDYLEGKADHPRSPATTIAAPLAPTTSTSARRRSTAAPTRSRKTSSRR
jgi:hypothetical protein